MIKKSLFAVVALAILFSSFASLFVTPMQSAKAAMVTDVTMWATKDNIIDSLHPDANYGGITAIALLDSSAPQLWHSLIEFDGNTIPAGAVINYATLSLNYNNKIGSPEGLTVSVYKQTRTDWIEGTSTGDARVSNWNQYKTDSNWTTAGGDYVTSAPAGASAVVPASYGEMNWDITAIVQDAADRAIPIELLLTIEHSDANAAVYFESMEYDPWQGPKVSLQYTTDSPRPTITPTPTPTPTAITPVILVHGWNSGPAEWDNMVTFLENAGYQQDTNLFTIDLRDYFPWGIANGNIVQYAGDLSGYIAGVKRETHANKVDLVCHSMGGLVARWYTKYGYKNDVRNLVMIGTPNHGTPIALLSSLLGPIGIGVGGVAAGEMLPYSGFLNTLNWGDRFNYSGTDFTNTAIHHETIAGDYSPWYWFTWFLIDGPDDGLVGVSSVYLDGVNDQVVHYSHTAQNRVDEVSQMVLDILQGDTSYATAAVQQSSALVQSEMVLDILQSDTSYATTAVQQSSALVQSEQDNSTPQQTAVQLAPMISGKIFSVEQKSHEIPISATSNATFALAWLSGDLDLTLTTPSGTTIDPSVAEGNANISYYRDGNTTIEGYTVINPETGIWQVNIAAVNVSAEGEDYTVLTFFETTLNLSTNLAKYQYDPGEQISIAAELKNDGTLLTGASVSTEIQRPDESVESLALYDDGLHGDGEANDGIYANAYANTTTSGMYKITIFANGLVDDQEFARQAIAAVWSEYYSDLTLSSSDISFSDDAPLVGGNVTISAIISNIGEANAVNASILFFDGVPADDVLIGEDVIDVNAGQTDTASVSWNVTAGQHEIHVMVSPFNAFLDKDYENNEAYTIIDVYNLTTSSSNGGTVTTPGIGSFSYVDGENVSLVAIPNDYYKFGNWTGDTGTMANVSANSTTIIMNGNYSVQANFVAIGPATTTYTFASGGGIDKWCSAGHVHLVDWNNGHPQSPLDLSASPTYGFVSGGSTEYTQVSASDNVQWRSNIAHCLGCCLLDRNVELFTFKINEDPSTITGIQIKWEGHGTTGETVYYTTEKLWNASVNSWNTLHNQKNITSDVTWTDNISSSCSDYIDATGNLNVIAVSQRSGLPNNCGVWTDYIEVTVTHQ